MCRRNDDDPVSLVATSANAIDMELYFITRHQTKFVKHKSKKRTYYIAPASCLLHSSLAVPSLSGDVMPTDLCGDSIETPSSQDGPYHEFPSA